jgi:hypothetical protein
MTNPRVADWVHYLWSDNPRHCHAALVTELGRVGRRGLMVAQPTGVDFVREVPYASLLGADRPAPGTWHGMDECGPVDPEAAGEVR